MTSFCSVTDLTVARHSNGQLDRRILCTVIWFCSFLKGSCTHDYLSPRLTAFPHCNRGFRGKRAVSQSSTSLLKIYSNIFRSIWLRSHMSATSAGSNDAGCIMSDIPPPGLHYLGYLVLANPTRNCAMTTCTQQLGIHLRYSY